MTHNVKIEQEISETIDSILQKTESDAKENISKVYTDAFLEKPIAALKNKNPEHFRLFWQFPQETICRALIKEHLPTINQQGLFFFSHADFVEMHFKKLIEELEGSPCCADKSRTIMKALAKYYVDDKPIEFNYNSDVTYHLPDVIFRTHDEIVSFSEALYRLYYAQPQDYIKALSQLIEKAN